METTDDGNATKVKAYATRKTTPSQFILLIEETKGATIVSTKYTEVKIHIRSFSDFGRSN